MAPLSGTAVVAGEGMGAGGMGGVLPPQAELDAAAEKAAEAACGVTCVVGCALAGVTRQ